METSPSKSTSRLPPHGYVQPLLHDELLVDEIFTRLPAAAAVRFRAVCRAWNAALTSDHFLRSRASARQPELLFFVPAAGATTSFYTCTLRNGEAPPAARELLTVRNLSAEHLLLSPRPCHGLTLIVDGRASEHYVCNLSTGEHVALPHCEPAAAIKSPMLSRIGMGFHFRMTPWTPFELASTGLGFDQAAGEHKVVRLFKNRSGETSCEVCVVPGGPAGWRPCTGRVPPHAASFVAAMAPVFVGGHLYWLLEQDSFTGSDRQPILSFSVGAEQFGCVQTPRRLAQRISHLTDLDDTLCAVVDLRHEVSQYALFTWSGTAWSVRCSINLQSLQRPMCEEFIEEQDVVPLCSAGGKILLATGRHKVFAYDPERDTMERVFYMQEFVDVPYRHREARLRLNISLHEEHIVSVHQRTPPNPQVEGKRLQVKRGSNTVGKRREVSDENHDNRFRDLRDIFEELARLPLPHMNYQPNYS